MILLFVKSIAMFHIRIQIELSDEFVQNWVLSVGQTICELLIDLTKS